MKLPHMNGHQFLYYLFIAALVVVTLWGLFGVWRG